MNADNLVEQLHETNAKERQRERIKHLGHRSWWLAIPAAAAAVLLLVLIPQHSNAEPKPVTGLHVYCNNNCQQADALDIIQQNINAIRTSPIESEI